MIPLVQPEPPPGNPFAASVVAATPVVFPRVPRSGGRLSVAIAIRTSDGTTSVPALGTVRCAARVGTHSALRLHRTYRRGMAACAWRLPRATGRLVGFIQFRTPSGFAERTFTLRVRG